MVDAVPVHHPYQLCSSSKSPAMTLENEVWVGERFRRMHVETGITEDGFSVLHCVIHPDPRTTMPIFGCDIARRGTTTTLCITDLSPVEDRLPRSIRNAMTRMQDDMITVCAPRTIPAWGKEIFSEECVCVRPLTPQGTIEWIRYTLTLHSYYLEKVRLATLAPEAQHPDILEAHSRYARNQKQNEKTAQVLVRYFGSDWTRQYVDTMLFPDLAKKNLEKYGVI